MCRLKIIRQKDARNEKTALQAAAAIDGDTEEAI